MNHSVSFFELRAIDGIHRKLQLSIVVQVEKKNRRRAQERAQREAEAVRERAQREERAKATQYRSIEAELDDREFGYRSAFIQADRLFNAYETGIPSWMGDGCR